MQEKEKFIVNYLDDYVIMAYRELTNSVNNEMEGKLISNLNYLLDVYSEGRLKYYVIENKIV